METQHVADYTLPGAALRLQPGQTAHVELPMTRLTSNMLWVFQIHTQASGSFAEFIMPNGESLELEMGMCSHGWY